VTGHTAQGKAVVASDATVASVPPRPGQEACVIWADRIPADNLDPADGARRTGTTMLANGAIFRVVRYAAGTSGRMHRTRTLDYGVLLSGSIVLLLDDDVEVKLQAGDVLVQRGTIHNWINRGSEPCTIAFVLVDAAPIAIG
jgi:quercetin dioxygenase-like cupin family protein